MSRRRSGSSTTTSAADRDVVMGPPPVPGSSSGSQPKSKDSQEISEKYRKLKRRFFELEEKHKETSTELQRSGERNVKMREERNILLDRIIELESENPAFSNGRSSTSPPSLQPSSSAFPRTMLNARARTSFVANVRDVNAEDDAGDDVDPITNSRYPGSEARRRGDDDHRERYDEDSRDSRNSDRRSRGSLPHSSSSHQGSASPSSHHNPASSSSSSSRDHSRHSPVYPHPPQPPPPSSHDEYRSPSPRRDVDVEMSDDRGYDKEPRSNGDFDQNGRAHDTPGPRRGEVDTRQMSFRRQEPTPGPSQRSTRRSSRVASTNHDRTDREVESEHMPRTRGAAKRGASSSAIGTRMTRRESAAAAKTEAHSAAARKSATSAPVQSPNSPPAPSPAPSPSVPTADVRDTQTNEPSGHRKNTDQQRKSPASAGKPYASTSTSLVPPPRDLDPTQAPATAAASQPSPDPNIDPALASAGLGVAKPAENRSAKESSPMDNIVKVAEAAVAAQRAASASQNSSTAPSTSASPAPSQTQPSATAGSSGSGSSSSPKSYNPYMHMVPGKINTTGMASPPGMSPIPPNMNPYAMYYPPGTPVTPGTPGTPYPYPYANPYYYLTGPMPGPSSMYPPSPNFVPPSVQRPASEIQRQAKPKRLKAHTVTSKHFNIPMVPRDKRGKPMLPLNVGIMTVISLGDVCMREHFHTERYIFPVGYEVTRRYLSTVDPNVEVVYHCTILDGGDGPKFQIVPSDVPDRPVIAGTATGAWSSIVKQANAIRNRQHSNSVSGPDFFGLGQNTIKHLIQELPNADRLRDYVWQTFVEGGPLGGRHAAVIPALPEEYDAAMPIGAYYPTDRDKRKRDSTGTPETPSPKGISHYPQHIIAQAEAQRAQQQALQQAQQMGAQPLKPGELSGLQQQQQDGTQMQGQSSGTQIVLPPLNSPGPVSFQDYRPPQIATSAARTPQTGSGPGSAPAPAAAPSVPATFASIMNAYPASGAPPPPPAQ